MVTRTDFVEISRKGHTQNQLGDYLQTYLEGQARGWPVIQEPAASFKEKAETLQGL
jgi:hypothetical protein